ncbi:MAG: YraN family protein [Lachnospiraceae bacterium]|nr:YraN family protein [Lachnospiraceae bacterium]
MNKRELGARYEQQAAAYLQEQGLRIVTRNFRCRIGEIDLIAAERQEDREVLVFVEVKYRTSPSAGGGPLYAVNRKKQLTIMRAAEWYLMKNGLPETTPCRFDVVGITPEGVEHIRNAFWL